MLAVKIAGTGHYLPVKRVLSSELDERLNLPLGSVEKKSGLIVRHFASPDETTSYMGAQAALKALESANLSIHDIDGIISACGVSEQAIPCTAALIQRQLGLETSGISCFDINSTCLSFLTAVDVASHLIASQRFKRLLIVSSDIASVGINWKDLETCTIFGDGAAACILEKSDNSSRILAAHLETYSKGADFCQVQSCGTRIPRPGLEQIASTYFQMDGKKVFKLASEYMVPMVETVLAKAGVTIPDLDWVIPHQASLLAMQHIRKRLQVAEEKFANIYAHHGNQIAASLPTVLSHLVQTKQLHRGQLILLLGTGAGFALGGIILEY